MNLPRFGTSFLLALSFLAPAWGVQSTSSRGAHSPAQLVLAGAARETLFVGDAASGEVHVFTVDTGGGLAPVAGSPFAAPGGPDDNGALLALSTSGDALFVLHATSNSGSRAVACDGAHVFATLESPYPANPRGVYSLDVLPPGTFAVNAGSTFQAGTTPFDLALWVPGTGRP